MILALLSFTSAPDADVARGLLGWLSVEVERALILDGITVRRTSDDRVVLSFPERRDSRGRRHAIVRPVDDDARRAIEHQIFDALQGRGDLP